MMDRQNLNYTTRSRVHRPRLGKVGLKHFNGIYRSRMNRLNGFEIVIIITTLCKSECVVAQTHTI